ncbi:MAG: alpha/beta hydrolase [Niabella sp.]|nr:alpha/beta hydrolase [Niabella sp.]
MTRKFVRYKQSVIGYYRSGSGPRPAICLHGFNESAQSFAALENKNNRYSILAIAAPFHEATQWEQGLSYSPSDLHEIIIIILNAEGFPSKEPLTLIGFSLGGRMALSYYEQYPETIEQLMLIAPDGLKFNFWYWFAVHTSMGNRLFHFTMYHPDWFIRMAALLSRLGIINAGIKKFVTHYLHNDAVRSALYKTWTAFRPFDPRIRKIKRKIIQYQTPIQLYFGKYDNVIPAARGFAFIKGVETCARMHVLQTGHRLLQAKEVQEALNGQ